MLKSKNQFEKKAKVNLSYIIVLELYNVICSKTNIKHKAAPLNLIVSGFYEKVQKL